MSHTITEIKQQDKDKIIRPKYGQTSLTEWEPFLDKMLVKLDLIERYWNEVSQQANRQVEASLVQINQQLN